MRIAHRVATALLLGAMATQASAQTDPHHSKGTEAATMQTTAPATGCPAPATAAIEQMPRAEAGASSQMAMMRMMMMQMQQMMMQMQENAEPGDAVK